MVRLQHKRRSRAIVWLTLCCFTLFSSLPGYLLPSAQAGVPNLVVICTQDGWVEVDLGTDSPANQRPSHDCGHCILCFCPSLAGPSQAVIDVCFHGSASGSLSPSATAAARKHGPRVFWLPGAPRAPPAIPLS